MIFEYFTILWGILLLYVGSEYFLKGTNLLYLKLAINNAFLIIIFISIYITLPNLLVFFKTFPTNHVELSYGNILGSNIFSVVYIIFILTLKPFGILGSLSKANKYTLIAYNVIFIIFILFFKINYIVSIILWLLLGGGLYKAYSTTFKLLPFNNNPSIIVIPKISLIGVYLIFSILCLIYGTFLVTDSSITIGKSLNTSDQNIGLSLIAILTSLPLVVIVISLSLKQQFNMASYILIISNIFNVTAVAGIIAWKKSFYNNQAFIIDSALFFIILILLALVSTTNDKTTNKYWGIASLTIYILYIIYLLIK